jgi:hypothetical protein
MRLHRARRMMYLATAHLAAKAAVVLLKMLMMNMIRSQCDFQINSPAEVPA